MRSKNNRHFCCIRRYLGKVFWQIRRKSKQFNANPRQHRPRLALNVDEASLEEGFACTAARASVPLGSRVKKGNPMGTNAWALPRLQGGSVLIRARACPRSNLSAGCGWARLSPHVTVWGLSTASSRAEHLPHFTEPLFSLPPAAASPHTQCFPCSAEARTSLSCCLLSLMVENPQGNAVTLIMTRWELFSWLNFFTSVSEVFRDSWEESCLSWYVVWWCDNLDCHHRADVFGSSREKIISTTEV